jgi:TfoX/Sxy family transcriptional regulator of competence genes
MNPLSLVERLRERLQDMPNIEEKKMFSGITFMLNDKMCIGVSREIELFCRIDPAEHEQAIERLGCRAMIHKGREMQGYVFISEEGYQNLKDFDYWLKLCLDYNPRAKASKKKK